MRVLTPLAHYIHATNSPLGLPPSADIAEFGRKGFTLGLGYLDTCLGDGRPYLAGNDVTIGDCTLAAALQFARFAEINLDSQWPNIQRWDTDYRVRGPAKTVLSL